MESSSGSGVDPIAPKVEQILAGTEVFQAPILARSLGQLATSFGGFFGICAAMYLTLAVSL